MGLEDGAKSLFTYQNQLVHGLMQTDDYAAAAIRAAQPAASADEVQCQIAARATRQALLTAANPLQVWAVLDEAVLRRHVGGPTPCGRSWTVSGRLQRSPNVTLEVLPFDAGAHASMGTSFEPLQFPEPGDTAIVYIEDQTQPVSGDRRRHRAVYAGL